MTVTNLYSVAILDTASVTIKILIAYSSLWQTKVKESFVQTCYLTT